MGLSYELRLKFLNIKSLESRRKFQLLKFIFKIVYNFPEIPSYLRNQIIVKRNENGCKILKSYQRIYLSNKYYY